jgi:hypothetical protein
MTLGPMGRQEWQQDSKLRDQAYMEIMLRVVRAYVRNRLLRHLHAWMVYVDEVRSKYLAAEYMLEATLRSGFTAWIRGTRQRRLRREGIDNLSWPSRGG